MALASCLPLVCIRGCHSPILCKLAIWLTSLAASAGSSLVPSSPSTSSATTSLEAPILKRTSSVPTPIVLIPRVSALYIQNVDFLLTRRLATELKYMQTKAGSKLITSGWWGMSRHINYLGDWLMSLSWSLPCGFATPIPYFYPIYFGILLLHRERRDDHKCRTKYGEDWERYCKQVKYRIIPGIY